MIKVGLLKKNCAYIFCEKWNRHVTVRKKQRFHDYMKSLPFSSYFWKKIKINTDGRIDRVAIANIAP